MSVSALILWLAAEEINQKRQRKHQFQVFIITGKKPTTQQIPCLLCTALVYGEAAKGVMVSTALLHGCSAEKLGI